MVPPNPTPHAGRGPANIIPQHFVADCSHPLQEPPMSDANDIDDSEESFAEHTLLEAIENQLEANEPPAAQATLNKLTLVGYEREEILHLMALVLADEIRLM